MIGIEAITQIVAVLLVLALFYPRMRRAWDHLRPVRYPDRARQRGDRWTIAILLAILVGLLIAARYQ